MSPPTNASPAKTGGAFLLAPALIFALALAVRVVGLTWGLPDAQRFYCYHPDESPQQIVGAVFHLLQGDFNPHFFNYPSLTVYATWFFYQILAGFGLTTNALIGPNDYPWPVARDVVWAGRLFSVLCGAGTAALSWGVARQLGLQRGAIVAGVLVALLPGLVQHSHFATVDVPATFFVVWCVWLSLRAQTLRAFALAALVAGLAAGTKYNAGLVVVVPVAGVLLLRDFKGRWAVVALAPVVALLGFVLTTPYALLAPAEFWGDPAKQLGFAYELFFHPREGSGDLFQGTGNGWLYHLTFNLPFVMTAPLELFALIGIGFAARERKWWPILAFVGLFFLSLGLSQVRFMRYLFPLAPFLCVAAAWAAAHLPRPKIWGAALALMAAAAVPGILGPFVALDPRDAAAQIIKGSGATPVGLANNPWFFTPPFQPVGFNVPVPGAVVVGLDAAKIRAAKPPIFTVSEYEYREAIRLNPDAEVAKTLRSLGGYGQETRFGGAPWLALPGRNFVPHDYLYTNPETRVYLRRF